MTAIMWPQTFMCEKLYELHIWEVTIQIDASEARVLVLT